MPTTIRYQSGSLFEVAARSHTLLCDQPREDGGTDLGPEPLEYLDAALGTCVGVFVRRSLETAGIPAEGLCIEVSREIIKEPPRRVGKLKLTVRLPAAVDDRRRRALLRAAAACTVHHTLEHPPEIEVDLQTGAAGAGAADGG